MAIMAHWNKPARAQPGDPLTRREHEILALLAEGMTTPQIAERLGIRPGTIKTHLTSVYRKTGAQNRVQAARHYLDQHAPPSP